MNKKSGFPEGTTNYSKFSISLSEDVELFLDHFKHEIREKNGARISRSEIIRAAIRYISTLKPDLQGIKNEGDILERFINASRKVK